MKANNFWYKLRATNRPILALAPMAGFTDSVFRMLVKKYGADVLYSEMVSVAALYYGGSSNDGALETKKLLQFNRSKEKPYVVQLFGAKPKHFAVAAKIISDEIKPDGIDINFGCPVPKVMNQGAGSALMADIKRAREVIEATLENTKLPVSIKIRTESGKVKALDFLESISDLPISALMIHGRTLKQGFAGEVNYNIVKDARRFFSGVILINGGINSLGDASSALLSSQADGLGLGRGALGRPWLFQEIKEKKVINFSSLEILKMLLLHVKSFVKIKGEKSLVDLRKHLVWYVQGFSGATDLRSQLVKIETIKDVEKIIEDYKTKI